MYLYIYILYILYLFHYFILFINFISIWFSHLTFSLFHIIFEFSLLSSTLTIIHVSMFTARNSNNTIKQIYDELLELYVFSKWLSFRGTNYQTLLYNKN